MPIGIIFDLDGTLVDSFDPHLQSWKIVSRRYGFDFPDAVFMEIFGSLNCDYLPKILGDRATPELVEEIDLALETTYREIIARKFPAMPGAEELVRSLHEAGYRIAVGSSAPKANVDAAIRGLGIAPLLSAVVCQDDVERVKPDPAIFLTAAKRMGIPPENCVVVEDSTFGIAAAKAAGMFCIGIQSGQHRPEEYELADRTICSLTELDPASILRGVKSVDVADLAVAWHSLKPKRGNCAQAVAYGLGRDDLLETLAPCGGGRAPGGICGALHAALLMLPEERRDEMKQKFRDAAGEIHCRSIRQAGQTSCSECVRIGAKLADEIS